MLHPIERCPLMKTKSYEYTIVPLKMRIVLFSVLSRESPNICAVAEALGGNSLQIRSTISSPSISVSAELEDGQNSRHL